MKRRRGSAALGKLPSEVSKEKRSWARRSPDFVYPKRARDRLRRRDETHLNEEGFPCAVTTVDGANHARSAPLALRRMGMRGDDPYRSAIRLARSRIGA